jgi:hypothetical protein
MPEVTPPDSLTPPHLASLLALLDGSALGRAFAAFAGQAIGHPLAEGVSYSEAIGGAYSALFGLLTPLVGITPSQTIRGDNVSTIPDAGANGFHFADVPIVVDGWWRIDAAPGQTVDSVAVTLDPSPSGPIPTDIHLSDLPGTGLGTDSVVWGGRTLFSFDATGGHAIGLKIQTSDGSDATVHGFVVTTLCR